VNRCPSCRSLVPAGWIACRSCGAALTAGRPVAANENALPRRPALASRGATTTLTRPAPVSAPVPGPVPAPTFAPTRDTLLPGDDIDTLVSATARTRPRTTNRTRILVTYVALATAALIAWTVVSETRAGPAAPTDPRLQAEAIVRRAATAVAPTYSRHDSYASVTPLALSRTGHLTVVSGDTSAHLGAISIKSTAPTKLIIATPMTKTTCVFGQDDAGVLTFAFTAGHACRAALAPSGGWGPG
jgi:hypothetical protein